jgi:hypothetical protein
MALRASSFHCSSGKEWAVMQKTPMKKLQLRPEEKGVEDEVGSGRSAH